MTEQQLDKRIIYLDVLRVLAIFAVITIHVTAYDVMQVKNINTFDWWVANVCNSLSRWGVPVFFMISGVLLLGSHKEESMGQFLRRRIGKIGIPFIIWSVIYSVAKHYFIEADYPTALDYPGILLKEILLDRAYPHLWFVYIIIGIYLVTPFIRKVIKHSSNKEIKYWIGLWLFAMVGNWSVQTLYQQFHPNHYIGIKIFDIPLVSGLTGFFILGYYLHTIDIERKVRQIIYAIATVSFLLIPIMIYIDNKGNTQLEESFYSHYALTTIVISIGIFIIFKYIDWNKIISTNLKKLIISMSNATFGIYLVHMLVLQVVISSIYKSQFTIINIMQTVLLTYIISYFIVMLAKLNKFMSKYVFT